MFFFSCEYLVKRNLFLWSKLTFQHHYSSLQKSFWSAAHLFSNIIDARLLVMALIIVIVEMITIFMITVIIFIPSGLFNE